MTRSDYVYVSSANGRTRFYHTNKECFKLRQANTIHKRPWDSIQHSNRDLCAICANDGEQIKNNTQGSGHYESLLNAATEESSG